MVLTAFACNAQDEVFNSNQNLRFLPGGPPRPTKAPQYPSAKPSSQPSIHPTVSPPVSENGGCEFYYDQTHNTLTQTTTPCAKGLNCVLNHPESLAFNGTYDGRCMGGNLGDSCKLQFITGQGMTLYLDGSSPLYCGYGTSCVYNGTAPTDNGTVVTGICSFGMLHDPCKLYYVSSTQTFLPQPTGAGVLPAYPLCRNDLKCDYSPTTLPSTSGIVYATCESGLGAFCQLQSTSSPSSSNKTYVQVGEPCPMNFQCVLNGDHKGQLYNGTCQRVGEAGDSCQRTFHISTGDRRRLSSSGTSYSFTDNTKTMPKCADGLHCITTGDTQSAQDGDIFQGTCEEFGRVGDKCQLQFNGNSGKSSHDFLDNYPSCDDGLECLPENDDGLSTIADGTCQNAFCDGNNNHADHAYNVSSSSIRVTICHRTCSERNPWVRITIDDDAWNGTQASGCGHQNHWVNGTCDGKNMSKWGGRLQDYLLWWHGYKSSFDKSYWDKWEPSCPYVRSDLRHNPCCNRTAGECCGDPAPISPSTPRPSRSPSAKPSQKPSMRPSQKPSSKPSSSPSFHPSSSPSAKPSHHRTSFPSATPSHHPSPAPINEPVPTTRPTPVCEPPAPSSVNTTCISDIKFLEKDGNSPIGNDPFIILEQMDKYVSFKIKKQWNLTGPVYVQYFDPTHEQYYCVQSCDNATILAHCLTRVKIAIIEIWVETDNPFDNANISSCCFEDDYGGPPKGKYYVEGTYELWCDSKCDKE